MTGHLMKQSFDGRQVALLRRAVSEHAAAAGLAEARRQDFVLAVDEIVTNAVRHGGGGGILEVWLTTDRIWFRVSDEGPGLAVTPVRPPGPSQLGGRGLWIANQITDELTITSDPTGTVVVGAIDL
jgi:anti-sigma regulatory factor (Ser/Thr protein kinase)